MAILDYTTFDPRLRPMYTIGDVNPRFHSRGSALPAILTVSVSKYDPAQFMSNLIEYDVANEQVQYPTGDTLNPEGFIQSIELVDFNRFKIQIALSERSRQFIEDSSNRNTSITSMAHLGGYIEQVLLERQKEERAKKANNAEFWAPIIELMENASKSID